MNHPATRISQYARRNPVAAGIASILALAAPMQAFAASTWAVTNCADSGAGSLRATISAPTTLSGDTVDMHLLACQDGKIALTLSSISIGQNSLTILGPGKDVLTIDASALASSGRAFDHAGTGTLDIRDLRITDGQVYRYASGQVAIGGCLYSKGSVSLTSVKIDACNVTSLADRASGGAIYTKGALTIDQSEISGNSAYSGATGANGAFGGGIAAVGTLTITKSTISGNGANAPNGFAMGGGVRSGGNVKMTTVEVSGNTVTSDHGAVSGGGISSGGNLQFDYGLIAGNSVALAKVGGGSGAGGASVNGNFAAKYSTIDSNQSSGSPTQTSSAGVSVRGDVTLEGSTISNNSTTGIGAALYTGDNGAFDHKLFLRNSTISGNHANWVGGIVNNHKTVQIYNSTIAFNTATTDLINTTTLSPGLQINPFLQDITVKLQSTIVSNNTSAGGVENDFAIFPTTFGVQVTLTDSLLRASSEQTVPTTPACPLLGPLRDNGGFTQTHALLSHSPAIDHGDNVLINPKTSTPYGFDQRGSALGNGSFDYVRESGSSADIGAYEVQQDDIVFNAGFEGCPALP